MNETPIKHLSAALNPNADAVEFASLEKAVEFIKESPDGIIYLVTGEIEFVGSIYVFPSATEITAKEIAGLSIAEVRQLFEYKVVRTIMGFRQMANPHPFY